MYKSILICISFKISKSKVRFLWNRYLYFLDRRSIWNGANLKMRAGSRAICVADDSARWSWLPSWSVYATDQDKQYRGGRYLSWTKKKSSSERMLRIVASRVASAMVPRVTATSLVGVQSTRASHGSKESDEEFDQRYVNFFNRNDIDHWEVRKAMNDLAGESWAPVIDQRSFG